MLMLDRTELARYGFSLTRLHLQLLKRLQKRSFAKADGLIFLSGFARDATAKFFGEAHKLGTVIPHGVNKAFFAEPEVQRGLTAYSRNRPFRWVYVSHIAPYKHHRRVVEALGMLRQEGLPVAVDLIGGAYPGSSSRALCKTMERVDPRREFVRLVGEIPYHDMPSRYHRANGAIYASSCENLPNILLESMAAGLPIACSNRPPMPETLGAGGVYFDPERPEEIANACRTLMADAALRETLAWKAYKKVQGHTWEHCADRTFAFLARVGRGFGKY